MDLKDVKAIDETSRKKIVNNTKTNYFVEAGAGSGKTTALVSRMVSMIENGIDISKISAITFTKAAANEFYSRFQNKLIEKSNDSANNDIYLKALQNIDLAFMGTIDAFCNMIMSEHPNECAIPSNSKLIDDEQANKIYSKEYTNILNGLYNDPLLENKADKFLKFESRPEETFMLTLNVLLAHRDCKLELDSKEIFDIDKKYQNEIKTIRKIVHVLSNNLNYITAPNDEVCEKIQKSFRRNIKIFDSNWNENVSNVLTAYKYTFGHKDFRLIADKKVLDSLEEGSIYFKEHISKGKLAWYELDRDRLPVIIETIENLRYNVALDFVSLAKERILETLRNRGLLTFSDYLIYLRDTLRKDAISGGKLIKHIQVRHKYYLIDEFQDTDPIQAEIFFYLAAENINEDYRKCKPYDGSLFIVGDPKQSIYRFKNADVANYLKVEEIFKKNGGEVLNLYSNFRSTKTLKDWFNDTFKVTLKQNEDQAAFEEIPNEEKEEDGFTGVFTYEVSYIIKDDIEQSDEYKVKTIIQKLVNNKDYQITEKVKTNGKVEYQKRCLDYKDFMVITPSKPVLGKYVSVLKENKIPYYVEGNINFFESEAFKTLTMFYGAVTNLSDNRYLYGVLKSNLYKISAKEMNKAREIKFSFDLTKDEDISSIKNLSAAILELKEFAQVSKVLNPSSLFSKMIEEVNVFEKEGNKNMEYVFFVLESLKTKENAKEIVTHKEALEFFERLLNDPNVYERCPGLQKDGNQVHLANLHKVKGLEAPVVILAHPRRKVREPEFRIERNDKENVGYLFRVTKHKDNGSTTNIISTNRYKDSFEEKEKNSMFAEESRLAYVAATRAKNVLIISNCITSKGPAKENAWNDLINLISSKKLKNIEDVLRDVKIKDSHLSQIEYKTLKQTKNVLDENKNYLIQVNNEIKNPSKLVDQYIDAELSELEQKELVQTKDQNKALLGTLVHKMIEMIIKSNYSLDKDILINSLVDKDEETHKLLCDVYDKLINGGYVQNDNRIDILKTLKSAKEVYTEVPFTYKEDNIIWNGIIDLIYKDDSGWHIVDWKTNKEAKDIELHYQKQLEAYKIAFKKLTGNDVVDASIYHIEL